MLHDLEQLLEKDHLLDSKDPWIGNLVTTGAWARNTRHRMQRKVGSPIFDPSCIVGIARPLSF